MSRIRARFKGFHSINRKDGMLKPEELFQELEALRLIRIQGR
jgi:hypothetical protein